MYFTKRQCVVCWDSFESLDELCDHVGEKHIMVEMTDEIERRYISEVICLYTRGSQVWEAVIIEELAQVYGCDSPFAWYGPDVSKMGLVPTKTKPQTYFIALCRATGWCK